jgi:hypothetical protein
MCAQTMRYQGTLIAWGTGGEGTAWGDAQRGGGVDGEVRHGAGGGEERHAWEGARACGALHGGEELFEGSSERHAPLLFLPLSPHHRPCAAAAPR